jgi:hypothetical protein
VENFAKEFFLQPEFERELFLLSSGEVITATRVVHKLAGAQRRAKTPVQRGT